MINAEDLPDDLFTFADRYPFAPGHQDTDTSREAADDISGRVTGLRLAVLRSLVEDRTADECATVLGESVLAIRPRLTELRRLGRISDTGERRKNASGKRAIVWTLLPKQPGAPDVGTGPLDPPPTPPLVGQASIQIIDKTSPIHGISAKQNKPNEQL